jgi:hypothetical protein
MASLQSFRGLLFADAGDHAHYTLYNRTYFVGLIFADSHLYANPRKLDPMKIYRYTVLSLSFYLYNILLLILILIHHLCMMPDWFRIPRAHW